jgi:PAS domain S-box-containing protein
MALVVERTRLLMSMLGRSPGKIPLAATVPDEGERLRAFAEIGSDWFWEKDAQLRFTYMSVGIDGQAAPFAGDFIGKRIDEVTLPGFEGVDWRPLIKLLELRKPFREFHFTRRSQSGALRHLAVSGMPIFDRAGHFQGYRGTGRDLTKETLAEERAAIAQSRLIDAIEAIPEAFLLLDKDDRLVLCNSRYRELHAPIAAMLVPGALFADMCRACAYAGLPPDAKGREEEWTADRVRRHKAARFQIEERQIGGRWFQISEQHTRDGGTVVVQTEISALKRREQELAEKTALLRATLEHMEQGMLVLDAQLRIKMWNDHWIELVGVPPELVGVGLPLEPILRLAVARGEFGLGEIDNVVRRRLQELRETDSDVSEFHPPTGRIVEARRSPMPDGGILFTFADITERKRVEGDLRRAKDEAELASRSKTEFLANMSHELRTPLNAIIGFSDILMGQIFGPLGDARYSDYARDIRDSGLHLLNLINDVLDVSKVEFGKVELIEETVDVVAIVEACARLMRDRADTAGIRLVQELPPGLPQIQGDSRRLKQVLLNLLSNAVKFTPSGGRVTIRARYRGDDGFRLIVEDTGIGIAETDLEKAMRPFGQIDSRLARKYQGTGLGLPLARSMAELHSGKLELESAPGQGTTATIWLPPGRVLQPAPLTRPAAQG